MTTKKTVNVGLVGYKFMGKAHSHAYHDLTMFFEPDAVPVMKVLCGRDRQWIKRAAEKFGWEGYETSWRKLLARVDIDLVDITAPSDAHEEIGIAAAEAGKDIFCEKPMALTLSGAKKMLAAAQKAKVKHMINFNYRTCPAVALAKQMVDKGLLGTIYHWRSVYLQDWIVDPNFPLVWRLDKKVAGSGSLGDLAAHSIDLARFLVGEITEVAGLTKTFIKQRPIVEVMEGISAKAKKSAKVGKVTVDDAALFLAKFANGAVGTFEATRFAPGRKNHNRFEINGSRGSVVFNFERMNELEYYNREDPNGLQGFRVIQATDGNHPYMNAWWPPAHIIGYEHTFIHQVYNLMQAIAHNRMPTPSFVDGVKCQAVLQAVEDSAKHASWVKVPA